MEKLLERKKNGLIKELILKPYVADSLLHNTFAYPKFVQNFRILSQVVPEKSLTEKSEHAHTHKHTEKAKTIYPLYTSYTGGIMNQTH